MLGKIVTLNWEKFEGSSIPLRIIDDIFIEVI